MGMAWGNDMAFIQLQGADKGSLQFWEEMQRPAQKSHMTPDGFAACQPGNRLIYHCLENRGRQILFGGAFINQGLDIGLGKTPQRAAIG